jgi:hypothetical protein
LNAKIKHGYQKAKQKAPFLLPDLRIEQHSRRNFKPDETKARTAVAI